MKKLTIFTPTYNRSYCLDILYRSLLKQTNKNYIWLIIDDGSDDNTDVLVKSWINENKIEIRYLYKQNGGMHSAHNLAYENIDTEMNMCIDSDDYLPSNAVDAIYKSWNTYSAYPDFAGIIGLDQDTNHSIIGSKFKKEGYPIKLNDFYYKEKGSGDKKLVLRSDFTKAYPKYPIYENEKLVPLDTLYTLICRDYNLYPVNDVFCTVDYQPDGSSATIINQYFKSPQGFRYAREVSMRYGENLTLTVKSVIHYNISTIIIGDFNKVLKSPNKILTVLFLPLSFLIYKWLKKKNN